jgi:hypothetical protein
MVSVEDRLFISSLDALIKHGGLHNAQPAGRQDSLTARRQFRSPAARRLNHVR